jgi:RES domain-containing protein
MLLGQLDFLHSTMRLGAAWIRAKSSAALRVLSVVIPNEWNYLINPAHADFNSSRVGKLNTFNFDRRLASGTGGL